MSIHQGPAISVSDVIFSYGKRLVLNHLSIEIPTGQIFGLLGANGSGKTTLLKLIVGLLKPNSGSVQVFGERPSTKFAERIGYMPQLSAVYQELSVQENVDFFASMYGSFDKRARQQAVERTIATVGLTERRRDSVLSLSGGMRQRVSLAIALVHSPSLLMLDEPTVGLDPELRASFWQHFRELADQSSTLVLSSHTMDDAAHCDHLIFLQEGHIVADGSPSGLKAATGNPNASLEEVFLYFVRESKSIGSS